MVERAEEITDFAAFLTDLKTRSGLSYATLAKRLYLSQSTLHRYCNGDAVPTEYAPIERLARLCKATPEEQVELHRRWIVADAARLRDRRTTSTDEGPETGDDTSVPLAAEPDVFSANSTAASASTTDPLPPEVAGNESARPRRPLRPLLAVCAAIVLIAAVALVVRNATSGTRSDDAGAETSGPTDSSGSPSVTKSSIAAAPLALAVNTHAWDDPCDGLYLLDRPPGEVPPPPVEQDARGWVEALGGVAAGHQRIELTVQGAGKDTVVLQSLNIRVVQAGKPRPGAVFRMGDGCGGGVETKTFDIDLDAGQAQAKPLAGQRGFPLKVSESDPEVLYLTSRTTKREVAWYLEMQWSSGGRNGVLRIDDHGKPFTTTPSAGRRGYIYPLGGTKWEPAPPS
ncbi:helix-turn-helix domain-containing protein [Kribbella sp. DT2]|uniref:helix-turn-helix domain-containing protein n=1 Tax=Kribbella sp. DT2 TaxID=3393427 RepID=UPI003CEE369B